MTRPSVGDLSEMVKSGWTCRFYEADKIQGSFFTSFPSPYSLFNFSAYKTSVEDSLDYGNIDGSNLEYNLDNGDLEK